MSKGVILIFHSCRAWVKKFVKGLNTLSHKLWMKKLPMAISQHWLCENIGEKIVWVRKKRGGAISNEKNI